ncbi:MAG: tRNA threonylcarbamoyladenosine dehydratase [Saprospiraceae bacterium]|jgi:tRNA A37 threonylcarbamoyladenosine dehydratase|nr:tRNA threonylcarbamoyladenosine dehydratase [Saprospiraceae bacterium]MBL0293604.1 tRNA threonylcarbamoyladenosine dehydratase [Saprospiraceae bacterium]
MSEISPWMGRTQLLMGDEHLLNLINANVIIVGLGGVGGICAEMMVRAGISKLTIIDGDAVEETNRNRQIPALISTDGVLKTEAMKNRLLDINPKLDLTMHSIYLTGEDNYSVLDAQKYDYAVDCIDTLSPKVYFILACLQRKIPIVSSMGAGGRIDPCKVKIADLSKTINCNLAKYVRKRLGKLGVKKGVKCVFSPEFIDDTKVIPTPEEMRKKSIIGTISYMPAVFGCTMASVVIRDLAYKS